MGEASLWGGNLIVGPLSPSAPCSGSVSEHWHHYLSMAVVRPVSIQRSPGPSLCSLHTRGLPRSLWHLVSLLHRAPCSPCGLCRGPGAARVA